MQEFIRYIVIKDLTGVYYTGEPWRDSRGWSEVKKEAKRFKDNAELDSHIIQLISNVDEEGYNYENVFSDGTYVIEHYFELKERD